MNLTIHYAIDAYIRHEMTNDEALVFERNVLANPVLFKEVELTLLISQCLANRYKKLKQVMMWSTKNNVPRHACPSSINSTHVNGVR